MHCLNATWNHPRAVKVFEPKHRSRDAFDGPPKIDLRSRAIVGVEAPVRWQHPQRSLLGPDAFIPLAEKTGLIIALGEWVLDRACAQAAAWRRLGLPLESVSINVSALQVRRGDLLGSVANALERNGLCGHHIELELTESIFLQKLDASMRLLSSLRNLGVMLSIDDFGTGYSSLAYLKQLRVDRLKIDRSFIKDIPENLDSTAIVKTIIQLAHNVGVAVTAEDVETEEQLDILRVFGCDEAQGYLIGKPTDADFVGYSSRHSSKLLQSDDETG
jgi:diguanylate cyclase